MMPGRNDPCTCGSGKKYKKCCMDKADAAAPDYFIKSAAPTASECNRLIALFQAGQLAELEASARLMLERYADSGFVWNLLGASLQMQGKDGLQALQNAARFLPNDPVAHSNLGNALWKLGRLDEAAASYLRALQIKPDYAEAHYNLGNTQKELGLVEEEITSYRRAIVIRPDYAEAHNSLGNALRGIGQFEGAIASYLRAIEIKPDFAMAYNNLGNVLKDFGHFDGAVASYRRALEINPDYSDAYSNLLFALNFLPDQSPARMLDEARRYGEFVARKAQPFTSWNGASVPGRCLRIGLVSGDLRTHAVGYFLEGVLAALSAQAAGRLEIHAYSNHSSFDEVSERIKACCHGWRSVVRLPDAVLAHQIHDDDIDILLDISGHTAHNRLPVFAWKPAPIQAAWLGYFATTGVAAMDYLIADPWTLPETEETNFTEKIWRLPETRLCFTPPDVHIDVAPLPALADGCITFGCFNNLAKMNDQVVALWARVLASVPGSRLFLKARQLDEAAARQSVAERFAAHGIAAGRLVLEGAESREKYLAAYQRVDIALDPFPFTGGTTSAEALWMGVPVLTLAGERFLARQGVGLLMNAGLPEWIAADADDFVARAVAHAGDLQRLAARRMGLRQQVLASPIFDAPRFARHFEAALHGMWANRQTQG